MVVDAGSANQADNAQVLPWTKKINRKRRYFTPPIQRLLKMAMKANGFTVRCPKVSWEITRVEDQAAFNQALQQLIMGLEVAAQRQIISDTTYRETIRHFLPQMKAPTVEKADAANNFEPLPPAGGNGNVPVTSGQQGKNE
jgi:hypothetical protein